MTQTNHRLRELEGETKLLSVVYGTRDYRKRASGVDTLESRRERRQHPPHTASQVQIDNDWESGFAWLMNGSFVCHLTGTH